MQGSDTVDMTVFPAVPCIITTRRESAFGTSGTARQENVHVDQQLVRCRCRGRCQSRQTLPGEDARPVVRIVPQQGQRSRLRQRHLLPPGRLAGPGQGQQRADRLQLSRLGIQQSRTLHADSGAGRRGEDSRARAGRLLPGGSPLRLDLGVSGRPARREAPAHTRQLSVLRRGDGEPREVGHRASELRGAVQLGAQRGKLDRRSASFVRAQQLRQQEGPEADAGGTGGSRVGQQHLPGTAAGGVQEPEQNDPVRARRESAGTTRPSPGSAS